MDVPSERLHRLILVSKSPFFEAHSRSVGLQIAVMFHVEHYANLTFHCLLIVNL